MDFKIYACVDSVADRTVALFNAVNDGMAIRDNAQFLARIVPLRDMKLYQVGSIDQSLAVTSCEPREVDWNSYKLPRTNVPNVAPKSPADAQAEFQKEVSDLTSK